VKYKNHQHARTHSHTHTNKHTHVKFGRVWLTHTQPHSKSKKKAVNKYKRQRQKGVCSFCCCNVWYVCVCVCMIVGVSMGERGHVWVSEFRRRLCVCIRLFACGRHSASSSSWASSSWQLPLPLRPFFRGGGVNPPLHALCFV